MAPGTAAVANLAASDEVRRHLAQAQTGVYIVRSDGHIVWASPSMKDVTGRSPEDLIGRNGWDVFVPSDQLPEVARFKALLSESDGVIWMQIPMLGGTRAWFRIETWVRDGHILCAFRPEQNPALHRLHYITRPRR